MIPVNSGFKGQVVSIGSIEIAQKLGTTVKFRVLFSDTEGTVHAHTIHEIDISQDPEFTAAVQALLTRCKQFAETTHFTDPADPATKEHISRGIRETLSGLSDAADEPGEQG